jgi:hypothetical protein
MVQKLGVVRIVMMLDQLGLAGNSYGWEYICPVVFTLPKIRITIGTKINIVAIVRTRY